MQNGIQTLQTTNDADVLILKTAVELSSHSSVTVIGEVVDLAIFLIAFTTPAQDIQLLNLGQKKNQNNPTKRCSRMTLNIFC